MILIAVISGGTATNELVSLFSAISSSVAYILPVTDNGGSTSELLRVIGGPAIGDIRSRVTRLIPPEAEPLRQLLSYRLSDDPHHAKNEWTDIVEGHHWLWEPIEASVKEIFRSFLIHVHVELLKKSRNPLTRFRFELASIGNLFLTGARLFCGSLDSAITLVLRLTRTDLRVRVLPCLNTNFTYHISARLTNGMVVTGQSQISHPYVSGNPMAPVVKSGALSPMDQHGGDCSLEPPLTPSLLLGSVLTTGGHSRHPHQYSGPTKPEEEEPEDAHPPYSHPELRLSQLHSSKLDDIPPLPAPVEQIFYISPYGEEIHPQAHTRVLKVLRAADMVVYSIGSLMTSVVPVVVLKGVGKAIGEGVGKQRVLLLNGSNDRETFGMTAYGFLETIVKSCAYSQLEETTARPWTDYVTHVVHLQVSLIAVDTKMIEQRGVQCVSVRNGRVGGELGQVYDLEHLQAVLEGLAQSAETDINRKSGSLVEM